MLLSPSSCCFYFLVDIAVILTLFGFHGSSYFGIGKVYENLNPYGYSFLTSPFDFLIISILRGLVYTLSYLLNGGKRSSLVAWLDKPTAIISVASISFSFLKCLVYSDQMELQDSPGTFLVPAWNILSATYFYRMWRADYESCFEKEDHVKEDNYIPMTKIQQIKILMLYSYGNWHWLLVGSGISFISTAVHVAMPHYKSLVMNGITALREGVDIYQSIQILVVLSFASMLLSGLQSLSFEYLSSTTVSKMRKDLFDSIIKQEIAFFDHYKSGVIVPRVTSDVDRVSYRISDMFTSSLRRFLTLGGKVLFMVGLSWRLTLINFITFPIIIYISKLAAEFNDVMGDDECDSSENCHQIAEERNRSSWEPYRNNVFPIISTIRTIRSFAAEKRSSKKFADAVDKTEKAEKKEALASLFLDFSSDLYHNCMYVFVLVYGAKLVSEGKMEPATLVSYMMYQLQIGQHVVSLTYKVPALMGTLRRTRKFCQFLTRQPRMDMAGTNEQPVKGALSLEGVSFTYPSRPTNKVINDLTLRIRAGETLALVGPSGGGKSTIVALLERFYDPDEGEITLDGVPAREFNHEYYHSKIALVAQEPVLYDCSVRENIRFGCDATEEEIIEAAKVANAHDFVTELEKGYDTTCGEKGTQMSGGQKQRIAIARAIVRNPSILILDEATSALDNQSEQIVQEAMQRCAGNRTVIVIAHRLSTIQQADRIAVINKGKLVQLGSHEELLKDKEGLYYTLVRAKDKSL